MKFLAILITTSFLFLGLNSEDTIILKSGRKIEGVVVVKGNEVHLIGKYGTIIYNAADVTIQKEGDQKGTAIEVPNKAEVEDISELIGKPISSQIVTRSGRVLVGSFYQKGKDVYLNDLGGTVRIDPFVLSKKEGAAEQKVLGDVISGENCIVVLKSGRSFSGIAEEIDGVNFVTTTIGTVRVDKKYLDHIEKTGVEINIQAEQEKLIEGTTPKAAVIVPTKVEAENPPKIIDREYIEAVNKKADEALKESQTKRAEIKTVHENQ